MVRRMKYKPSKKLKPGMLCQMRGGWLVPARNCVKVVGVWVDAADYTIIEPGAFPTLIRHGAGLVVRGSCTALAGKAKK